MKTAKSRKKTGFSPKLSVNNSHYLDETVMPEVSAGQPPFQRKVGQVPTAAVLAGQGGAIPPVLGRWFFSTATARAQRARVSAPAISHPAVTAWQSAVPGGYSPAPAQPVAKAEVGEESPAGKKP